MLSVWDCPDRGSETHEELVLSFDRGRAHRLLILPALFDEANKLRRFTVEAMRRLDTAGIDTFLPDLPGCNESPVPLGDIAMDDWRRASAAAAVACQATHVLGLRGGALLTPGHLPGWHYAPASGAKLLRSLLRARVIASREAAREETIAQLESAGRCDGLALAGWQIGAPLFRDLESAAPALAGNQAIIDQASLGGPGLWLRAEPGESAAQADALAGAIAGSLGETR